MAILLVVVVLALVSLTQAIQSSFDRAAVVDVFNPFRPADVQKVVFTSENGCNQANGVKSCGGKVVYNFNTSTCYAYSGYYMASNFTNLFVQYVNQPGAVGWATFFFTGNQCSSSTLTGGYIGFCPDNTCCVAPLRIRNYFLGCFEVKGPRKTNPLL
jgi:hypothetical protein